MPIAPTDIVFRLSGGIANANPVLSLGDAKSATVAADNLFDTVTSAESVAGSVEHRCIYVHNAHATLTLISPKLYVATNTPNVGTTLAVGVGAAVTNAVEALAASETAVPAGVTFSSPTTALGGIALGDIPPGQHRAVWVRRTVSPGALAGADSGTIAVTGSTA